MEFEGPPLEILLRRIAEIPADFLAGPKIGRDGSVVVPAVVYDVAEGLGWRLSAAELAPFTGSDPKRDEARLAVVLQLCWSLADGWLKRSLGRSDGSVAESLVISSAGERRAAGAMPATADEALPLAASAGAERATPLADSASPERTALLHLLSETATQLALQAAPAKYVQDPDRREELARLILAAFGRRPAGETKEQAQDRLTSLSGLERNRVLKASRAAEERARAIRAALTRKAAEESADKWTRE